MNNHVIALVLLAAVLHAGWNALLRGSPDRLWSMTIMCVAVAFTGLMAAPFLPLPAASSWPYIVASAVFHVGYNLFLVRTYRSGDLGQTYPIARGSSPLLITLGAALFAGERLDLLSLFGIMLVSAGIISLAFQGRRLALSALPYAFGTGCFIGAYSVTDGLGARLAGDGVSYIVWMGILWAGTMPLIYIAARDWRSLFRPGRETLTAAGGGLVSILGYGIVIQAMISGPLGPVSALRETSVIFAAIFGRVFLHERLTAGRLGACAVIAMGAICLG